MSKCPNCESVCETCDDSSVTVTVDLSSAERNSHTFVPLTTVAEMVGGGFNVEETYDYVTDFTVDYTVPTPSFTIRPTSVAEMRVMEQLVALSNSSEAMADRDQSEWPDRLEDTLNAMREFVGDNFLPFLPPEPSE